MIAAANRQLSQLAKEIEVLEKMDVGTGAGQTGRKT